MLTLARKPITVSAVFGSQAQTRSPACTPCSRRAVASANTSSRKACHDQRRRGPDSLAAYSAIWSPLPLASRCAAKFTRAPVNQRAPGIRGCAITDWYGVRLQTSKYSHTDAQKRSEEQTSELQSLMRISYAVFCLKKKKKQTY